MSGAIRDHVAAVIGLLQASGLAVFDGGAPDGAAPPYAVVYADQGATSPQSLSFRSVQRSVTAQTTCVGVNPEQARWAAEKVEGALLDVTPTVAGRVCWPIRREASQPVRRDDDLPGTTEARFYAIDVWRFQSAPA